MATNQDNTSTILSLEGRSVQLCSCTAPSHPTEKSKGRWGWNRAPLHSQVVTYSNSHRSCVFLTQNSSTVSFLFSIKSKLRTIVPKSLSNLVLSFWSPLGAPAPSCHTAGTWENVLFQEHIKHILHSRHLPLWSLLPVSLALLLAKSPPIRSVLKCNQYEKSSLKAAPKMAFLTSAFLPLISFYFSS